MTPVPETSEERLSLIESELTTMEARLAAKAPRGETSDRLVALEARANTFQASLEQTQTDLREVLGLAREVSAKVDA